MDLNNDKNIQNELDFEKMNATLANPEFANWYYNQMYSKTEGTDNTIDDFIKIVKEYSERKS